MQQSGYPVLSQCIRISGKLRINLGAHSRSHSNDKLQNASLIPLFVGMFCEKSKTRHKRILKFQSKLIQVEYLNILRSPRQHFSDVSATFQDKPFCKQHALGDKRCFACRAAMDGKESPSLRSWHSHGCRNESCAGQWADPASATQCALRQEASTPLQQLYPACSTGFAAQQRPAEKRSDLTFHYLNIT